MNLECYYKDICIKFDVIYRNRKTLGIQIGEGGRVSILSPRGVSKEYILKLVSSKGSWILTKQREIKLKEEEVRINKSINKNKCMYLGSLYKLIVIEEKTIISPKIEIINKDIIVTLKDASKEKVRLALEGWYREKTLLLVEERIKVYEKYFNDKVNGIKVKEQKRRWASCTYDNRILFNWRCSMAPLEVMDYIVVHEMCHMVHKNHSKDYWDSVKKIMPDYKKRHNFLKENGYRMDID